MTLIALLTRTPRSRPERVAVLDAIHRQRAAALRLASVGRAGARLHELGFPRRFPIVQFPNAPLIVAFLAGQAGRFVHGADHDYTVSLAYLAMTIWAYEELVRGVNWFRHVLGVAYAIIMIIRVAHALQA